jgi:multiple sugar transport system substrate-binding protein
MTILSAFRSAGSSGGGGRRPRRLWGKPVVTALAVAGLLATATAGCGSSGGSGSPGGGKITLTEIDDYPAGLPQYAAYQWLFDTYEKTHPNVKIQRQSVSGTTFLAKLLSEAQTHTLPDLAAPDNPDLPNLEATGQLTSLTPYLNKWGQWDSYLPGVRAVATSKGQAYGILIGTNALGFFYNKKIFSEAGITTPPATWAQMISDSKTIVAKVPGLTYGAVGFGGNCGGNWQLLPYIYQQGLDVNDLTSPGVAAAVNFWATLLKDGSANKEVITQCQSTNIPQLIQGKLAMAEDGPWDLPTFQADHFTDWGAFSIPLQSTSDHESVPLGGEVWTIPKSNPATEQAAWNFIQWSQTPSILLQFDAKLGYFSVRPSLWPQEEKANPAITPFINELKYAKGRTTVLGANFNTYSTDLNTALVQVLEGQKTATDALSEAATSAKASIGGSGSG